MSYETKKQLAIVAPYFGLLPAHFQLWLNSCAANPQVTWLLYIDDRTEWVYPENVIVTYCTLDELRVRFQKKFNFEIALPNIRKLGDWKPLYGFLFEEELAGFRAWGHVDVGDVIYGDFSGFVTDELIESYDRLGYLGHLTIYRNTPENNRRFMSDSASGPTWREVISTPEFMNFEELAPGSIDDIWHHNNWSTGLLCDSIADLRADSWAFWMRYKYRENKKTNKDDYLIFEWNSGKLFGHWLSSSGEFVSKEYLYVHFKRRRMLMDPLLDDTHYLIVPGGFVPAPEMIDVSVLKGYGGGKFPDPQWLRTRWSGIKTRLGLA